MPPEKEITKYTDFLRKFLHPQTALTVVCDFSNGSAGPIVTALFRGTQVKMIPLAAKPDGDFPEHGPNPLAEGAAANLCRVVVREKADLGAIFDSDGDRVLFVDNNGRVLDAYDVFALIKGSFEPPYVVDARALAGFTMQGEDVVESRTGRYFVWRKMKESGASLGIERSGHYFFKDFFSMDSGILAAIHVINAVGVGHDLASEILASAIMRLPEINFPVTDWPTIREAITKRFGESATIYELDGLTVTGSDFAFNIRPSATEPLVRLNLAAREQGTLDAKLAELKKMVK